MNLRNIPAELQRFDNWTGWKEDGARKPFNLQTNGNAMSNNPATWSSFAVAKEKLSGLEVLFDGIGLAIPTGFVGFDFDGVVNDGVVEPLVLDILAVLQNPYCEISPSGKGLRAFVKYDGPALPKQMVAQDKTKSKYGVEIFAGSHTNKILTITGDKFSGEGVPTLESLDDAYFLCSQLTNYKFKSLWEGDISEYQNDHSSADLALMGMLARLTNKNAEKMEYYFDLSALGQRNKWTEREDYRNRTIQKALSSSVSSPITFPEPGTNPPKQKSIVERSKQTAREFNLAAAWFEVDERREPREIILENCLVVGDVGLTIGRKKARKSLFEMERAMCIAAGKDWYGHNCPKARKVAYFDSENGKELMMERYQELLKDFTPEEQALIAVNFYPYLTSGRAAMEAGVSLDYKEGVDFWNKYAEKTADCEVHFLDCLYNFHSKEPKDNNGLAEVIRVLQFRCSERGNGKTVVILNHTRSMSNDDLKKLNSISLPRLGAEAFSEQAFGGKVALKMASMVYCVDHVSTRDEDGEEESDFWYLQFFGRVPTSPLMKFESTDGFCRVRMIRELSKGAARAAYDLKKAGGSWVSFHEMAKLVRCARSRAYILLRELRVKGCLIEYWDEEAQRNRFTLALTDDFKRNIEITVAQSEAIVEATEWLKAMVTKPMRVVEIFDLGEEAGHLAEDLVKAKSWADLVEYSQPNKDADRDDEVMWRPKKRPGLKKGSAAALLVARKGVEARAKGDNAADEPSNEPAQNSFIPEKSDVERAGF